MLSNVAKKKLYNWIIRKWLPPKEPPFRADFNAPNGF